RRRSNVARLLANVAASLTHSPIRCKEEIMLRHAFALSLVTLITALGAANSASAVDLFVGARAPASQRIGYDKIDHTAWDELLKQYVNDQGLVDYEGWKASGKSVTKLNDYLNNLSAVDPRQPAARESELAYWINAYNAVTVKGILEVYPTTSIRNHTAKVWGYNIWKNLKLRYADAQINLEDIEHQVLRKRGEPRIHFAIVCASIGCPRLLNEAYVPERLDEQLSTNARHFFAQQQNFQIDRGSNTVRLSSILKWFGEDFGATKQAQLQAISPYLPSDEARAFVSQPGVRVAYLDYDWNINEQK
ncbi:MAG: DUF547 domain-containing protein, partial [Planctomycetota bacterium]